MNLKAQPDCCEEAAPGMDFYMPCNAPAVRLVKLRDEGPYRMCAACARHNIRRRGGEDVGPYIPPTKEISQ